MNKKTDYWHPYYTSQEGHAPQVIQSWQPLSAHIYKTLSSIRKVDTIKIVPFQIEHGGAAHVQSWP